jgi:hypothetical protein
MACARVAFGGAGETLWAFVQEDSTCVLALDARSLEEAGRCQLDDYPPPAYVHAIAHPEDDVGSFQILCGQDGIWMEIVERTPKRLKIRKHRWKPTEDASIASGVANGGAALVTASESLVVLRAWPTLTAKKKRKIPGAGRGAATSDDRVIVAYAEVGQEPRRFELLSAFDLAPIGSGEWPANEILFAIDGDYVLTTRGEMLSIWRVEK